jgi:hypothetical protein
MSGKISLKRITHLPLICLICGDVARGMNFDVMTCMSCKAFFRRNALRGSDQRVIHCQLNNDCIITPTTRGGCSACRLTKCFVLGMNSDLIRSPSDTSSSSISHRQIEPSKQEQTWLSQVIVNESLFSDILYIHLL